MGGLTVEFHPMRTGTGRDAHGTQRAIGREGDALRDPGTDGREKLQTFLGHVR